MKKIRLPGVSEDIFVCTTFGEIATVIGEEKAQALCRVINFVCKDLNIPVPDITFVQMYEFWATMHTKKHAPDLKTPLLSISDLLITLGSEELLYSVVAHELRHLWQYTHCPELDQEPDLYGQAASASPKEIDADAYGAAIASAITQKSIEAVLFELDTEEEEISSLGGYDNEDNPYTQRVQLAKKIRADLARKYPPKRPSLLQRLGIFFARRGINRRDK